jgi:hypothetical protein
MATEDTSRDSEFSGGHINASIAQARRNEYLKLFSDIGSGVDVRADYNGIVRFIYAGGGLSAISGGWLKGIEYVPVGIKYGAKVLPDLDKSSALPDGVYLRPIEPGWYVVYQKTD